MGSALSRTEKATCIIRLCKSPAWGSLNDNLNDSLNMLIKLIIFSFFEAIRLTTKITRWRFYQEARLSPLLRRKRVKTYKLSLNSGRCHQFDGLLKLNMLVILQFDKHGRVREESRGMYVENKNIKRHHQQVAIHLISNNNHKLCISISYY